MSKKKSPTLLTAKDYMSDLAVKIDNAKQRVNMVATTFRADDKHTEAVIAAVERAAAERGGVFCDWAVCLVAFRARGGGSPPGHRPR